MSSNVITLDSDSEGEVDQLASSSNGSVTVSIINEVPLNLELLHNPPTVQVANGQGLATGSNAVLREIRSQNGRRNGATAGMLKTHSIAHSSTSSSGRDQNVQPKARRASKRRCGDSIEETSSHASLSPTPPVLPPAVPLASAPPTRQTACRGRMLNGSRRVMPAADGDCGQRAVNVCDDVEEEWIMRPQFGSTSGVPYSGQLSVQLGWDTYIEAQLPAKNWSGDDEFDGQFKCTYNCCSKVLRHNVAFMNHMWAHVVRLRAYHERAMTNRDIVEQKSYHNAGGDGGRLRSDVDHLLTCPECLIVRPTPHQMQLHYHLVHNGAAPPEDAMVCRTCELVHDVGRARNHANCLSGMPFHCKKCNYRVSSRVAFLCHFTKTHIGTCVLLCPFCVKQFRVPFGDRQRPVVTVKEYVEHIVANHEQTRRRGTLVPVVDGPDANTRDKAVRKLVDLNTLSGIASTVSVVSTGNAHCAECTVVLLTRRKQRQHFRNGGRCDRCSYSTSCAMSLALHEVLGACRPANRVRWPIGVRSKPYAIAVRGAFTDYAEVSYKCTVCGLIGVDGDAMSAHVAGHEAPDGDNMEVENENKTPVGVLVQKRQQPSNSRAMRDTELLQRKMSNLFGLHHLCDIPTRNEDKNDGSKLLAKPDDPANNVEHATETLRNIVHGSYLQQALRNPTIVRFTTRRPPTIRLDEAEWQLRRVENIRNIAAVPTAIKYPASFRLPWRQSKAPKK